MTTTPDENLTTLPVFLIDVQTTASSPEQGRILEMAWTRCCGLAEEASETHVIAGGLEEVIPKKILKLTGIAAEEVGAGVPESVFFERLASSIAAKPSAPAVAHWVRFEARFLEDLWQRLQGKPAPLEFLCTHQIAKRLWPELPSGSLRSVAGWVGHTMATEKRAADHVKATGAIWRRLCEELASRHAITTLSELQTWLKAPAVKGGGKVKRAYPMPRETRLAVPKDPGVYRMLAADRRVLYVGKATSLRDRVNSYFRQQRGHNSFKLELLSQAVGLDVTPCATAVEAALLETDEIKRLNPPYNSALKQDSRTVGWLDRDLLPSGETAAPPRYGPFCPADALMPLHIVAAALRDPISGFLALAELLWRDADAEALLEGLGIFAAEWGISTPRELLARALPEARRLEKEAAAAAGAAEDEDEQDAEEESEDEEKEELPLTAPEVATWLGRMMISMARTFLRARRVAAFADTVVAWRSSPASSWRWLRLDQGQIVDRGDADGTQEIPSPLRPTERSGAAALPVQDVVTWDRLRVLATELGVVVRDGGESLVRRHDAVRVPESTAPGI